jgi:hypothetical protein
MRRALSFALAIYAAAVSPVSGQEIFRSVQSANLPTAEVLPQGSWLFEISHRFSNAFSEGADALWGLDGPAVIRLGLSYSVSDQVQLGIVRSNYQDNIELNGRARLWSGGSETLPVAVAAQAGVAWNPEVSTPTPTIEDNEMQAYGLLIINALIAERFAVGAVPTFVYNPRILDADSEQGFYVGLNGQVYLTPSMSVLLEWIVGDTNPESPFDPVTFGIEFNTGGHVFKLLSTNQLATNPTQYFPGSAIDFEPDLWRFGFNITRLLPF